ncbi:DUF2793 domain-containing protein [Amorphus sp. MBR-141]
MDRVNGADFVDIGGGRRGFRGQSLGGGVIGTEVTAAWLNAVQENLMKVIEAGGFDGNIADWELLWKALQVGQAGRSDIPVLGWQAAPPGAPSVGDRYVVQEDATGAWAGHDHQVATWFGAWAFAAPMIGQQANFLTDGLYRVIYFDGSVWAEHGAGRLLGVQVFSAAGTSTYTPTDGTRSVVVELVGGGGGGGGAQGTGPSQVASGSGGGAGGYALKRITSGFSGVTVTVGAGGVGISANNGSGGGTSSFGALVSATGGGGGTLGVAGGYATTSVAGGAGGGNGSSGDLNAAGGYGKYGIYQASPASGEGGASHFGAGAAPVSGTSGGNAAASPGAGGSGGVVSPNTSINPGGGAGMAGLVLVWEYA